MFTNFFSLIFFSILICGYTNIKPEAEKPSKSLLADAMFKKGLNETAAQEPDEKKLEDEKKEEDKVEGELELLDEIVSEITSLSGDVSESIVVTKQDIARRGFDGQVYTREKLEDEVLADQFSKILKATISDEDVNRNLKKMGMNDKQIADLYQAWGYLSKEEFFEDLKKVYRAKSAINFETESQLVTSEGEIKRYYDENPIFEEMVYTIETAFVPFSEDGNNDDLRAELKKFVEGIIPKPECVVWDNPIQVKESEITDQNRFLTNLNENEIYIREASDGFVIYKMKNIKNKHLISLDDRRDDIVEFLRKQKYPHVAGKMQDKFRSKAIILHPGDTYKWPENVNQLELEV